MADHANVNVVEGSLDASGLRIVLVVGRFNAFITDKLAAGAMDALIRHGASPERITLARVPGCFEIPAAARVAAAREDVDAVVAVGCLLRGDTIHFDLIAAEAVSGLAKVSRKSGKPVTLGIITANTLEQAIDRAGGKAGNKGAEAALAAVEQTHLLAALSGRGS